MASTHLTKSRVIAGQQCHRRLWKLVNEPPDYDDPDPSSPVEIGQIIGQKAHLLFPGGILVDEEAWQHSEALARTTTLMADLSVPAIFEAAFEHEGIRVRVDILERLHNGSWGLREVKSSGHVKDYHLNDLAVQAYVVREAGIKLPSVELIHVNTAYERGAGEIDWPQFFHREDAREKTDQVIPDLLTCLPELRKCLQRTEAPENEIGGHCFTPFECEYWDECTADKPDDWVVHLPHIRSQRVDDLKAKGIESISSIPADYPLSERQSIIREVTSSGRPFVSPGLGQELIGFGPPALYLDFETMNPAIPLYEGTHPYQIIPFQWSLHRVEGDGSLHHHEFLAVGDLDPRREFAESLIEAVGTGDWPIIVYSPFEQSRLNDLSDQFPDLESALRRVIVRLADLLPIVRKGIYHPDFHYSNSIKAVAPALCPNFSYDDLDGIADGGAASSAFAQLASGQIKEQGEIKRLRNALLAYCERDTLAMVELHRALIAWGISVAPYYVPPS